MLKDIHNRLRPLGFVDVLDEAIELYKSNFLLLVGIAAFLYVPYTLFTISLQNQKIELENAKLADLTFFFVIVMVSVVFYIVAAPIVTGALTYGISERYLDRETSIAACYRRMLRTSVFFPFLWTNILVFLILIGASAVPVALLVAAIAFVTSNIANATTSTIIRDILVIFVLAIPAIAIPIYVWARLLLVAPAFVIEMRGPVGSIVRSWQLMKGSVTRAFGLMLIVGVVVSILQAIISSPITVIVGLGQVQGAEPPQSLLVLNTLIQTILSTVLAPLASIVTILLYYDQRIRKEGFDLELLARDLESSSEHTLTYYSTELPQERRSEEPEDGTKTEANGER
jgi:hypothetical protein